MLKGRALNCLLNTNAMKQNDCSKLFLQSAIGYYSHFVLLQLSLLFVIGIFLVNNVFPKPLYLEDLDDKLGLFETNVRLQHVSVNKTSQNRGKRHVVKGISDLCLGTYGVSPKPASGCVQRWLHCKVGDINLTEPQCASQSYACLPSIAKFGFPRCKSVYKFIYIPYRNGERKIVKLNTSCECA